MPQRQIPPKRKAIYYIGIAIGLVGLISFLSTFVSAALNFGDFTGFEQRGRSMAMRAIVGMVMMIAGSVVAGIGRAGLAGSGIKLDPEEARRDVEPWSRMTGGVLKDALDEADIRLGDQALSDELPFDERLRRLQKLREDGLISEQEYEATKKKILDDA